MIIYTKITAIVMISFLLSFDQFSIDPLFGTIIDNETTYDSPFLGGFNKPKIQWMDWNNDGRDDLFLLDEDGHIKYYSSYEGCNQDLCFILETTSLIIFKI